MMQPGAGGAKGVTSTFLSRRGLPVLFFRVRGFRSRCHSERNGFAILQGVERSRFARIHGSQLMRNLFSKAILLAVCYFLVAPSSSFAQVGAKSERFEGTIAKIDPAKKSMQVQVGKKLVDLNRADFDQVLLVRNGRETPFNMDDAQLLKFSVSVEITTTEDKTGKKKRTIKIQITR
jgi:hypothetical protein